MQLGVRLSERQHAKLAEIARRAGTSKSNVVRALIDRASAEIEIEAAPRLSEEELLDLLTAQARAGRTAALLALLRREREQDPRTSAMEALTQLAQERRQ